MALDRSLGSFSPQNEFYLLYYYFSNLWPPGWGQFWPQGYLWKELINVHKATLHTKNQCSRPSRFREEKKNFEFCLLCSYVQICDPKAGPILISGAPYEQLGWGQQGDASYQISKLYAFHFQRRRILKMGFFISMFQLVAHGLGPVWPWGFHMNTLGRGPLEDATYQI